ncbi:MAG TPA: hypothetical protein VGO22_14730 [Pseudorhizobium sp.]|jgi:hypothetical protein|nr:hypothetical protein [Pseudorhizobium sp.]
MQTPAEFIINELGGLTKTARLLSTDEKAFPISTVQGWKDRGKIPQEHWLPLIEAAKGDGKAIDLSMFLTVPDTAGAAV